MNAPALALTPPLPAQSLPDSTAPTPPASLAAAQGQAMTPADCVKLTADQLRAACQRGQLEDASAAARIALPTSQPHSAHQALLRALAPAQPSLMQAPEENRLYLLRGADGGLQGTLRLRDSGRISTAPGSALTSGAVSWTLRHGQLLLKAADGQARARFALCGEHDGLRLYLGQSADARPGGGAPLLLQEVRCTYTRLSLFDPELAGPFFGLFDIEQMVPAELPAGATLVLAAPHCGAEAVVAALNRCPGVMIDGELLHPLGQSATPGLPMSAPSAALAQARSSDAAWFARMMLTRSHDALGRELSAAPVRGFTLAPQHARPVLDWAMAQTDLRIVYLTRSNLLAEYADTLASDQGVALDAAGALHFEPERFVRFMDMKERCGDALRQRLTQRNADTVALDSSHLSEGVMGELLSFLCDAPTSAPPCADLITPGPRPVSERFDNPQAVLTCLGLLGRGHWAEPEGTVIG